MGHVSLSHTGVGGGMGTNHITSKNQSFVHSVHDCFLKFSTKPGNNIQYDATETEFRCFFNISTDVLIVEKANDTSNKHQH